MNLEEALGQFERAETNVSRLEAVAKDMEGLVPAGISFADTSWEVGSGSLTQGSDLKAPRLGRLYSVLNGSLNYDSYSLQAVFDHAPRLLGTLCLGIDAPSVDLGRGPPGGAVPTP